MKPTIHVTGSIESGLHRSTFVAKMDLFIQKKETCGLKEAAALWIYPYAMRLDVDPDISCDFFLIFFPQIMKFLKIYRERNYATPVCAFLLQAMRNSFFNYIRKRNRRKLYTIQLKEEMTANREWPDCTPGFPFTRDNVYEAVDMLPDHLRAIIKINRGFPLKLEDIRYLLNTTNDPHKLSRFLLLMKSRQRCNLARHEQVQSRNSYYYARIFQAPIQKRETVHARWRSWRAKMEHGPISRRSFVSLNEISVFLGLPLTSIIRRKEKALRLIRYHLLQKKSK